MPEDVHRILKSRAAASGSSMSEYLRRVLARAAARPTPAELSSRIAARGAPGPHEPAETLVRAIRDAAE